MKFWENFSSFNSANDAWNKKQASLETKNNVKKILFEPKIKIDFSKLDRIKTLFYLIKNDKNLFFLKKIKKNPLLYLFNLFRSYITKEPYRIENDFFLHNFSNSNDLKKNAFDKNATFIFGFSYCQKPINCPKKRFSSDCIHDYRNDICCQCFIGKCANAINKQDMFLVIPDINFIGKKIFEIYDNNPKKNIVFIISACELSIKLFSDYANMLKIKVLGIKLTNRVCTNFKSFLYAEKGIKTGITDLHEISKNFILEILKIRYSA